MTLASRILLAVAVALLLAGVALAITQPGSLGDDESAQDDTSSTSSTSSTTSGVATTTTASTSTTSSSPTTSTPGAVGPGGTDDDGTGTDDGGTGGGTGTGGGGSGFGDDGAAEPSDTSDGLAATGGESLLLTGVLAGVAGLGIRRRAG